MSLITIQINPTDEFELKQIKKMIDRALEHLLKEKEKLQKKIDKLGGKALSQLKSV